MSTEVSRVRSDDRLCLESTRLLSLYLLKLRKFIILYFIKEASLTVISFIKQWLYAQPMPFLWFYFISPKSHLTFKFEVLKKLTWIWWTPCSSSERCTIGLAKNLCRFLYKMGKPKWDFWPTQYLKWCLWNNEPMSEVSTQWSGQSPAILVTPDWRKTSPRAPGAHENYLRERPCLIRLLWWLSSKDDGFDLWVGNIPWRRKWQPTPVFLPREFHRQRSLVGYIQSIGSQKVRHDWACRNVHRTIE